MSISADLSDEHSLCSVRKGKNSMRMFVCSLLVAGSLMGAPTNPCPAGNLPFPSAITTAGSAFVGTCQPLTFADLDIVAGAGNPTPQVDLVGMYYDATKVYLDFNPNMVAPPGSGPQDIWLFGSVTGPLLGIDVEVGGVGATLIEVACRSAISPSNPICSTQDVLGQLLAFSPPNSNYDSVVFAQVNNLTYFMKNLHLSDAGRGGGWTEFRESFQYGVPEPATMLLGGAGLGLIVLAKRRRK